MPKVLSRFLPRLIWLGLLVLLVPSFAALGWSSSPLARMVDATSEQDNRLSALSEAPAFEDDDGDDADDFLESGLPAPGGGEEDGDGEADADLDAAPLHGSGEALQLLAAAPPTTLFVSPPGIRPSGGHRRTSERPPRV